MSQQQIQTQKEILGIEYAMLEHNNLFSVFKIENSKIECIKTNLTHLSSRDCENLDKEFMLKHWGEFYDQKTKEYFTIEGVSLYGIPWLRGVQDEDKILEFIALRNKVKISVIPENQDPEFLKDVEYIARIHINVMARGCTDFCEVQHMLEEINTNNIFKLELYYTIKKSENLVESVRVHPQNTKQGYISSMQVYGWAYKQDVIIVYERSSII